jgi:hypothetical protein
MREAAFNVLWLYVGEQPCLVVKVRLDDGSSSLSFSVSRVSGTPQAKQIYVDGIH